MFSDSYPIVEVDDVAFEVTAENITVGGESFGYDGNEFGGEEEGTDDTSETVINIVYNHRLQETFFDKKSFMSYIKSYMRRVKEHLEVKNLFFFSLLPHKDQKT